MKTSLQLDCEALTEALPSVSFESSKTPTGGSHPTAPTAHDLLALDLTGGLEQARQLEEAWHICADLFVDHVASATNGPGDLEHELLFCLLGGFGVTYELAASATAVLSKLGPFSPRWDEDDLQTLLFETLNTAQFLPITTTGQKRRYRFPTRKAELIVRARAWILAEPDAFGRLKSVDSEQERRELLMQCPGVGPKTASWILRNVGLAKELAILDVHIVRAMKSAGRLESHSLPRDYVAIEVAFLSWCEDLNAQPDAFDLFVWEWSRGSLGPKNV